MNSALKKTLVAMATAALGLTGGCAGEPEAAAAEGSEGGETTEHSCGAGTCGGEHAEEEAAGEEASCGGEEAAGEEASCGGEG